MILYHYTCDHALPKIREAGVINPYPLFGFTEMNFVWMTDLDVPDKKGLGLTSRILQCDRTKHQLILPHPLGAKRWVDVRRSMPKMITVALEEAEGALPMHWYVSMVPQREFFG
jgi:hypothetical protein